MRIMLLLVIPNEVWWVLGVAVLLAFFGTVWFIQWRQVRRAKTKYDKKDYRLTEIHGKPRRLEHTWYSVFGFLFFIGASIMGASFPIRALMLAVGMVVGHFVKEIVKGLKERKASKNNN